MLGAIVGDVIGSRFEWNNLKSTDFELFTKDSRFTDDTVLTIAVADAILSGESYESKVRAWGIKYPDAGYGGRFNNWLTDTQPGPYNSWGNGSAMRVSPVAWAFSDEQTVLEEAKRSAEITHNHPEGIKGAQAVAMAVFLGRNGESKAEIRAYAERHFSYDLQRSLNEIRPTYEFDVSCQGSVPEAMLAFLESDSFEEAIRLAISIGGDSDTIAAMAGAMAEAFYGEIPREIKEKSLEYLPAEMIGVWDEFSQSFSS